MNEVVKYDNYMNGLKFTGFTTTDFDFLMLLCSKMRDKDITELTIPFEELRQRTGYTRTSIQKFRTDLERMNEKLMRVTCKLKTETRTLMFVLFPTFDINLENQTLTVCVNEKFKFILNELVKNFTRFDLNEFIRLDSKYSKSLYRLLKQFKSTGRLEIRLDEFRRKMDIPSTYTNRDVMSKVINPILKELQNYFINLQCTVKYAHKRGKPVTGYIFTFTPEEIPKTVPEEAPVPVSKLAKQRNKLSPEEKDKLMNEFDKDIVELYVQRAMGYDHCYNYDTIRRWILQDEKKQYRQRRSKNQFFQFMERETTKEELDELEQKLLGNNYFKDITKEELDKKEQEVLGNNRLKDTKVTNKDTEETDKELDELERKLLAN